MKTLNPSLALTAALSVASLSGAYGAAQLRISDGNPAHTIIIVDGGPGDSSPFAGSVQYVGPVGPNWDVGVAAGLSKPAAGSAVAPHMDLTTRCTSLAAGTLTVEFTDTGFTAGGNVAASIGGNTVGNVTYRTYINSANAAFGKTFPLTAQGPFGGPSFADNASGPSVNPSAPFSLTIETVIQHGGSGRTSFDADLSISPAPSAAIGDRVWFDSNTNGVQDAGEPGVPGVTVQLFDCEDNLLTMTNTDLNGIYLFSDLPPGAYNIHVIAPEGFVFTLQNQGLDDAVDSDTDASGNMICTTLTAGETDRTWDSGLIPAPNSCLKLTKVADVTVAPAGSEAGYSYTVMNCGSTTLQNIIVKDDAGTPDFPGDDFLVGTIPSLAPGASTNIHGFTILPVYMCTNTGGISVQQGVLITDILPSGDIKATYRQSRNLNENVYQPVGNPPGWSRTHKFSDLTGSDKAEFRWKDANGNVVLDFFLDYISASRTFPSGYGSLGVTNGDGSMIVGNKTNVLSWTTTISDNLNQSPAFYGYTTNSPAEPNPLWDYVDGFTVVVSKKAFGAAGFGGVSVPFVHNSPAKTGANAIVPTPCGNCVTNIALAGTNAGNALQVMATAQAKVCPGNEGGCGVLGICTPPYPFTSANPLTSIVFNESEVLRTGIVSVVTGCIPNQIQVFYNDEHALELGVRQVVVKTKSGKATISTTNSYMVTALTSNPGSTTNPQVGSTAASGDQAGTDASGRPLFPALFVTDLTLNPLNPLAGDWQYGGTPIPPHAVFGTWKAAVRTVDKTRVPNVISLAVDSDPVKNNWNLGPGSDPVPAGLVNSGYGAEIRWDITKLGLLSGHTYRLYFMVHDGDQNKSGGDAGQACGTITMP